MNRRQTDYQAYYQFAAETEGRRECVRIAEIDWEWAEAGPIIDTAIVGAESVVGYRLELPTPAGRRLLQFRRDGRVAADELIIAKGR